ncbi:bifunctional glycosyl transferase/transpeptidase [Morganella morganii]|uniref:bifunctional glycosyl transferase/transpeptidase n=1 Tax=Morganella morganii TaxID=582 RepID=UPI00078771DB|nr:bifunctional glycosyl transferase/transpeptidase [Morganella morganii]EKV4236913.1 bifunctional glycosyl transferase/transpeptidase [Morganella morganii]ELL8929065.1 bifunctional glycosyl transferase/transpeptidase [Morganella morganii]ELY4881084.1 bifunctional glycosyl transferase/transpeptidase [Morganella morganii]MBS9570318.1 bifunctional glycosyl transferase/transpeptidase [Morganella morganii subsp. morganii]MBT0392658.1 bifunctional glycosyl transferase/transpeptidase [Morganella mor
MSDFDREPTGRRGSKASAGKKRGRSDRRRRRDEDYDDDIEYDDEFGDDEPDDDDYDDEEESPRMSKKGRKNKPPKRRWRWFWFLVKLGIVMAILLGIYGVYLAGKISDRLDGKVWDLPAAVYGRTVNLEPGMDYSLNEMVKLLEGMQYRKVTKITRAGEFSVTGNTIQMLRRPFDFPDSKEGQINARLTFGSSGLEKIENVDNGREFGFFRLDPKLITMLQSANGEQRLFLARSGFPDELVKALLVTEDRNFYEHDGISITSIGRALLANLTAGRAVQGGSTLTQQLVKNLFLSNERTLVRKANEAYMALIMDYRYDKDRILELYLNEVYLGQSGDEQIRGFPLASLYYFGRPVNELSLDQIALLVGMVKGASVYNPWRNPQNALERRNVVLKLLQTQGGVIDQEMYDVLSARPLGVKEKSGVITPQPAFMQLVRQELREKLGDKVDDLSGVKIFTTLDPVSQDAAENAVEEGVKAIRAERKKPELEGAMVVVDRISGEVRAMVGGSQPQFAGFNRAMAAERSIGSLAKPMTYLTALGIPDTYRLNTWLDDQPLTINVPGGGGTWSPRNDSKTFSGRVMLVDALARSINVPTVNLGMAVGLDAVADTFVRLGAPAKNIQKVPAMLLGAVNLTPLQVSQLFQTIGSGGNRATLSALRSVIAEDGTVIYQSFPQAQRAVAPQAAYMTLYGMQQVVERGTAARRLGSKFGKYHLAGKTGTTNLMRDSWFVGIDGKEVTVSWMGLDDNSPSGLYGGSGALVLYGRYLDNQPPLALNLTPPEDIAEMSVNADGNFVCNGVGVTRTLPVWTTDAQALCGQQAPAQQQGEEAPGWLKEMFEQ